MPKFKNSNATFWMIFIKWAEPDGQFWWIFQQIKLSTSEAGKSPDCYSRQRRTREKQLTGGAHIMLP